MQHELSTRATVWCIREISIINHIIGVKMPRFIRFLLISSLVMTASCCKQPQAPAMQDAATAQNASPFEGRKPFQYSVNTDLPLDEDPWESHYCYNVCEEKGGNEDCDALCADVGRNPHGELVEILVSMNSVDGKYPVNYDLDCDGDGNYEFIGLAKDHTCEFKRNSGKHQISLRGDIPGMWLCARRAHPREWKYEVMCPESGDGDYHCYLSNEQRPIDDTAWDHVNAVVSIDSWGDIAWKSMFAFAADCHRLERIPNEAPNLSPNMDMRFVFWECENLDTAEISWIGFDLNTPEGLQAALNKREKLHKAIPKISEMASEPEALLPYVSALKQLYQNGSAFDREVLAALVAAANAGADVHAEMEKAAASSDYKQVILAAECAKATKDALLQAKLLDVFDNQFNPEVKAAILETGLTIKNDAVTDTAIAILKGNLDQTPFLLLRVSCNVLAFQKSPKAADALRKAIPYIDAAGRSLASECKAALDAI